MKQAAFLGRPHARQYIAWLLPLAACLVEWGFWNEIKPFTWMLFYPAVFVAPQVGGLWGGVGATLISAVLGFYVFLPPQFSFVAENANNYYSVLVFTTMGVVFSLFYRQMRTKDERYRTLCACVGDGISIVSSDGRYVDVNDKYCAMLGRPRAEIVGALLETYVVDKTPGFRADIDAQLVAHGTATFERRFRRKDGTLLPVEVTLPPLHDNQSLAVVRDITDRLRAAEALARAEVAAEVVHSEWRHRVVADNTYDWEFWIDPQGRFLYRSPSGRTARRFGAVWS